MILDLHSVIHPRRISGPLCRAVIAAIFGILYSSLVLAADCAEAEGSRPFPQLALTEIASGFDHPVFLSHAGDVSKRLYVVEQRGVVRIIANGEVLDRPFLDISDRVSSGGEKGLLSIAFHPQFRKNGYFYLNYTRRQGLALYTIVSRFNISSSGRADPDSELVLLKIMQPFANHNGGQIAFGPDGYLYIGMGDGGLANDPFRHGQDLSTLLGALLRIDVDHQSTEINYAIPADNPFVGKPDVRAEIWAYGFRNPWRFSFDRANGRLWLADVGQDKVEEIDVVTKGGNYGWDIFEGDLCTGEDDDKCRSGLFEKPVYTYHHPEGFAITGGYVYRGQSIPGLCGVYLYADYVGKQLEGLRYNGRMVVFHQRILQSGLNISSFGEDQDGELYLLGHESGKIMKITAATAGRQNR